MFRDSGKVSKDNYLEIRCGLSSKISSALEGASVVVKSRLIHRIREY
jgi:hypothetical protein